MKKNPKFVQRLLSLGLALTLVIAPGVSGFQAKGAENLCDHEHSAECYAVSGDHQHDETCTATYPVHEHTSDCYAATESHTHSAECYAINEETGEEELTCELDEAQGSDAEGELICGLEAGQEDTTKEPTYECAGGELVCEHKDCTVGEPCLATEDVFEEVTDENEITDEDKEEVTEEITEELPAVDAVPGISGVIWLDDQPWDGVRQEGESGISGHPVALMQGEEEVATTVTDESGAYSFTALASGDYIVQVLPYAVDVDHYMLPLAGITADNLFAANESFSNAQTAVITYEEGAVVTGVNAGMREPMGVETMDEVAGINISLMAVSPTGNFATYDDNGTGMQQLGVALTVNVDGQPPIKDARIELPLNFQAPENYIGINGATTGEDFFQFVEILKDPKATDTMVESYTVEGTGASKKLVINIKDGYQSTAEILNIRFNFNPLFESMVPTNTTLWANIMPELYVGDAKDTVTNVTPVTVIGGGNNSMYTDTTKLSPAGSKDALTEYSAGSITLNVRYRNDYYYRNDMDTKDPSFAYLYLPTGSTFTSTYFNFGTPIEITAENYKQYGGDEKYIGYTRYARKLTAPSTKESGDWLQWEYGGDRSVVSSLLPISFIPPVGIKGEFYVYSDLDYKKANATERIVSSDSVTYVKADWPVWELNESTTHGPTGALKSVVEMNVDGTDAQAVTSVYASSADYKNSTQLKNTGWGPIKDTQFVLFNGEGTEKINFAGITLAADRHSAYATGHDGKTELGWSQYRVEYEIMKGKDVLRTEENMITPTAASASQDIKLTLPTLAPGEYINRIIITPMGTDGTQEGVWPGGNGFGLAYRGKSWPNNQWPGEYDENGELNTIPDDSEVQLTWQFHHEKNPNELEEPQTELTQGATATVYYVYKGVTTSASAKFISPDAANATPGTIVNYNIQGFNDQNYYSADWADPFIAIRVPKEITLYDGTDDGDNSFTFNVVNDGKQAQVAGATVTASLEHSDDKYNYYSFQVNDYAATKSGASTPVMFIPIQFKVAPSAAEGTYPIGPVVVSREAQEDFSQLGQTMNNLGTEDKGNYGIEENGNYTAILPTTNNTAVIVKSTGQINGSSQVKVGNGQWSSAAEVPAPKNSDVAMKVIIENTTNATLNDLKLYNILPKDGDSRGSTGDIEFTGVTNAPAGAKVYYYTGANPPAYDKVDLQNMDMTGWSTTPPADLNDATAVFIDFGSATLPAGQDFSADLNFKIPDEDKQRAVNQFVTSATMKTGNAEADMSFTSDMTAFDTGIVSLEYKANTGDAELDATMEALESWPMQYDSIDGNNVTFTVPDYTPVRDGYTFKGWATTKDGEPTIKFGSVVTFTTAEIDGGTILKTLYAVWSADDITVVYHDNVAAEEITVPENETVVYGDKATEPTLVPVREGYTFTGWYRSAADANSGAGKWNFDTDLVKEADKQLDLYAGWKANKYTINYVEGNVGTDVVSNMPYDTGLTGNTGETIVVDKTIPTRPGYEFAGWKVETPAGIAKTYTGGDQFTMPAADVTLIAQWVRDDETTSSITFVTSDANQGTLEEGKTEYWGVIGSNTPENMEPGKLPKPGYEFVEWQVNGDALTTLPTTFPAEDLVITAIWKQSDYTVTYDLDGGQDANDIAFAQLTGKHYNDVITITTTEPTRSGYNFMGWVMIVEEGGELVEGETYEAGATFDMPAKNVILKALWESDGPDSYDVTVNDSYATVTGAGSYNQGDTVTISAGERDGYRFVGWTINNGDIILADGDDNTTTFTMPNEDVEVTAIWEEGRYNVVVNDSAANTTGEGAYEEGDTVTINAGTRDGYRFIGWTVDNGTITLADADDNTTTFTMPGENVEVTANWERIGTPPPGDYTPTSPDPDPDPDPIDPVDPPEPSEEPESPAPTTRPAPPAPTENNVVVPTENEDYVELAPDGTPLGTWHFDPVEETWIFEPSDTPLGSVVKENPVTSERDRAIVNTFKVISVIGLSAACLFMFVRRNKREMF